MADRYELAFLKNALSATGTNPQEQTALMNLLFQRLLTGNFTINSSGVITAPLVGQFSDGTVGAPSIAFTNEPTTGRYRIGAGNVGEALLGALLFDWSATRLQLGTIHLTWAFDNTKDIGALLANRPRDFFLGRDAAVGGTLAVTGVTTLTGGLNTPLTAPNGGTGVAYFTVAGPSAARTYTFPDATTSVLTTNAAVTVPQGGTGIAAGTSGGVPYFSGTTTVASSAALGSTQLVLGGGAGAAPATDSNWTINSVHVLNSATQFRCVAYDTGAQNVSNASTTTIALAAEDVDIGNMHSTSSNTSRVTVPTGGDGFYFVRGVVPFAATAAGSRLAFLSKNGATTLRQAGLGGGLATATQVDVVEVTWFGVLAAADYIELQAYQDSGAGLNVGSATRAIAVELAVVKMW